ncbi:hypothetical protein MKO06_12970 [Gramella sp. GC03-9]|uniref:Uncharacterized protein n=1 Tax=Christiangramia oceanisediminis TaxID=2920386 RepID=A0A9X2KYQ3_9FLAO|nr:hypothetical protein [Gramella oceanisediminis]MCP9200825.1 hypothetical protein [Gramella oceanisediminis]
MKFLVLFITFLVLSLSILPCCFLEDISNNSLCIDSPTNNEDDHTSEEPCSPFFNCGSCSGFALQEDLEIGFVTDEFSAQVFISCQDLFKSAYQNPDFKPPRRSII